LKYHNTKKRLKDDGCFVVAVGLQKTFLSVF
jgi:hypothetical protein